MPRHFQTCAIHTPLNSASTKEPLRNSCLQTKYADFNDSFIPLQSIAKTLPDCGAVPGKRHIRVPTAPGCALRTRTDGFEARRLLMADTLRWRNSLHLYRDLDPWNQVGLQNGVYATRADCSRNKRTIESILCVIALSQGYIDIQDSIKHLQKTPQADLAYMERLTSILEDLVPFVSSRGVVEKDVAIKAIKRAIDESSLGDCVYGPLKSTLRFKDSRGFPYQARREQKYRGHKIAELPFYRRGTTSQRQFADSEDLESCSISPDILCRPPLTRISTKPWVDAGLAKHGATTKERKQRKIEALKKKIEEQLEKEEANLQAESRSRRKKKVSRTDEMISVMKDKEPFEFQRQRLNLEETSASNESPFYVLHFGEPPAERSCPWEDSLRSEWERRISQPPVEDEHGQSDSAIKVFDEFSRVVEGNRTKPAVVRPTAHWTPKTIFEQMGESQETEEASEVERLLTSSQAFSAPYKLRLTTRTGLVPQGLRSRLESANEVGRRSKAEKAFAARIGDGIDGDTLLLPQKDVRRSHRRNLSNSVWDQQL